MKTLSRFCATLLFLLPLSSPAQVNSGSNGSDGALNPTANLVIDMADHPDGIYHYTSVNVPAGVDVSFIPNAGNKPVVWLVQGDCTISGQIYIYGAWPPVEPSRRAPGGYLGGNGGSNPTPGGGPGGGPVIGPSFGCASFATLGSGPNPGSIYGNAYLIPLIGGSGGGGREGGNGAGGGGGGAILVASSGTITFNGIIGAWGGWGGGGPNYAGTGSGGAVRFVASTISGNGLIKALGDNQNSSTTNLGGSGRIRFDTLQNNFSGQIFGNFTHGFQPIILPAAGQGVQLSIASIAGNAVSSNPSGVLVNPDVIIPAQQANPIPIVVNCNNIPLNSEISVIVHPANGPDVQAVATNNAGTLAASTATVSLNMPRGGGIIYAKCVSGLAGLGADTSSKELRTKSLAETGWTADGERFAKVEVTAALGGQQQIAYISETGKRYELGSR